MKIWIKKIINWYWYVYTYMQSVLNKNTQV